jgi:hypothetical protein
MRVQAPYAGRSTGSLSSLSVLWEKMRIKGKLTHRRQSKNQTSPPTMSYVPTKGTLDNMCMFDGPFFRACIQSKEMRERVNSMS